jgi:secreted Zn-dependent insulinase-like peptidase
LIYARDTKIKDLTVEEVETAKRALIKMLEQKDLKLSDEVSRRWVAITDDSGIVDFDKREKKIHALE